MKAYIMSYSEDRDGKWKRDTFEEIRKKALKMRHRKRERNRYLLSKKRKARGFRKARKVIPFIPKANSWEVVLTMGANV